MQGALKIGSVRGVPIRIHWTFLLVLPLLAALFANQYLAAAEFAGVAREDLTQAPWLWGLLVAVGLFASVLLHELAHSLYALTVGLRVRGIVLLMIGGISEIVETPRLPRQEAMMALVGPLVSLGLGWILLGTAYLASGAMSTDVLFAVLLLGQLNLVLGIFNLLPAFPMDGGRILRALLTGWLGALRATRVATTVGKVFAFAFAVLGLLSGSFLLVLIAFFVWMGAQAEGGQAALREVLCDQPVRSLLVSSVAPLDGAVTLDVAAAHMRDLRQLTVPVLEGDTLAGVLTIDTLRSIPTDRWRFTAARAVAKPVEALTPDNDAWTALRRMTENDLPELPVLEDGRYIGLVGQVDILRELRLRELDADWAGGRPGRLRRTPV